MSDKKQIDRLFQEKLKDFEVMPNDHVWDNISKQLEKKKEDRKVIPIWWKFAGVAAILLLLFTAGNFMFDSENKNVNPVLVDTKKDDIKDTETNNNITNTNLEEIKEEPKNSNSTETNTEAVSNKLNNQTVQQEESTNANLQNNKKENNYFQPKKASNRSENTIMNASTKYVNNLNENSSANKEASNLTEQSYLNKSNVQEELKNNSVNTVITDSENKPQETINNAVANEEVKEIIEKEELIEEEKLPLTEDVLVSNDEINEEEKEKLNRWQVSPNIAPVYFNSLGDGSSIDQLFENNSKSGNVNLSYGINAAYAINDRLSVRTGVNKVNLSYDTNDVIAFQSLNANNSLLRNINVSNNAENVSLMSANNVSLAQSPEGLASTLKASLSQEIGFVEVPLELKYSVINKKLGVNIISGFSVLFLDNNKIYTVINEVKTPLGEANNINNTSYSANVGLGLDYKASKNVSLNLEPMFKYQINTFNNTSGDFKPYFVGVYTGINVKF